MLYARIVRSPHAHARVKRVNTERAKKLPGVRAILTSENAPATPWRMGRPVFDDVVRFVGDEVACVAADTMALARQAAALIEIEYEPLPFTLDPEQGAKPDAPKMYDSGNLVDGEPTLYERGDVQKAFKQADIVVEGEFETPTQMHNALETHGCVATWEGDQLVLYESTQFIHGVRDRAADYLGLHRNQVRVVQQYMGGGFGAKNGAGKYTVLAALLSRATRRPVRLFLDRTEENLAAGNRALSRQYLKIGAKKDGTLVALDFISYAATGAAAGWVPSVSGPVREMYECRNVRARDYGVLTNTGPMAAFRAPGYVEGMFALEVLMDELAAKLKMDPLALRIHNYARRLPLNKMLYSSNGLLDAYQEGAQAIDWEKKRKAKKDGGPIRRGVGMASQIWGGAGGPPSYADIKIHPDATATIVTGTQDIGTGTKTVLAQIAAEELGLEIEKIRVEIGDTQWGLFSTASWGSMTAASVGPAVREAAADAKEHLLTLAAHYLHVARRNVSLEKGVVRAVKRKKKIEMPLVEIMKELGDIMIVGHGSRGPNPGNVAIRTFGAQFAEVEVDIETGHVRVLKIVAAHDVGRVLNPLTVSSQIEGGVIQGLGFALMEQRLLDENSGAVVNPNLEGYHIPTMLDIPQIDVRMIDHADVNINNLGIKGAGEPPIIPTAPAIANAVYHALGMPMHRLPLTRDVILGVLEQFDSSDGH